jgi:hypothetical protein
MSARKTINEKFIGEQAATLKKILDILNIEPNNKDSYLYKEQIDKKTIEMNIIYEDIQKYYCSTVWTTIKNAKDKNFAIIRNVLKYHGFVLISRTISIKTGKRVQQYKIITKME